MAKDIPWVGGSLDELRDFPEEARREAGHQLYLVQLGLEPDDWRPMPSIGPGVIEIRLHGAFEKKTQKTSQADIDLGRENLKELRKWRREQEL